MIQTLQFFPGQLATVFLETLDGYGVRTNTVDAPVVNRIIFPNLTLASNYPQNMVNLDTGLYYYQFLLPTGSVAVGSYLVDVLYVSPATNEQTTALYQVIVSAPFGNYSASVTL